MRVLVLGGGGMLGHKVANVMSRSFEVFTTFRGAGRAWGNQPVSDNIDSQHTIGGVDATDFDTVARVFALAKPDVAINCIGIVKQVPEAKDTLLSLEVNSVFPHRLADLCQACGTRLVHISTDCVFSGRKGMYSEDDIPDPEDLYGRTKLLGEVRRSGCLTIRTSIFGRELSRRSGLLEWFLSNQGGRVKGYTNAVFSGFPTVTLARILLDLVVSYHDLDGLWHVSSEPISKHDLLVRIREAMNVDIEIEPDGQVVCDRSLDCGRFRAATGCRLPNWDEAIAALAEDQTWYLDRGHHANA